MLRFVVAPDGVIVPDLAARLPGRGIWLSPRRDVLDIARRKGAFARAARAEVTVPPDVIDLVETGLRRRVADLVGFARRAGMAAGGFTKARTALEAGRCGILLEASDGSADERRRLLSGMGNVEIATPLDARALGAVFGRDHMVHVAVAPGRLAGSIAGEAGRLSLVLGADGPAARSSTKAGA